MRKICTTFISNFSIFCSFPNQLLELSCDNEDIREKIDRAIRNINGIRACLNTPHMAFESIVKEEISRLEKPIKACVNLVVELLLEVVRLCTGRVSYYRYDSLKNRILFDICISDRALSKNPTKCRASYQFAHLF